MTGCIENEDGIREKGRGQQDKETTWNGYAVESSGKSDSRIG